MRRPNGKVYYRKLIRDGVVEKMKRNKVRYKASKLSRKDFLSLLLMKVYEEAVEVAVAGRDSRGRLMEEIADLEIVLAEIKKEFKIPRAELRHVKAKNLREKGGFSTRTFLVWSVREGDRNKRM